MQHLLFANTRCRVVKPFREQLLKWVGNKQRFAHEIVAFLPETMGTYFEPFLGSGAVLATLSPPSAVASDASRPLMEIWEALQSDPEQVKDWYSSRFALITKLGDKAKAYEAVRASYNRRPNGADLLFISRLCYGGVVRFRKSDGFCSTPCGVHAPMQPERFARRVDLWHQRTKGAMFLREDFREVMRRASKGDVVYCDPPYGDSQGILYGAQSFEIASLIQEISDCKARGVMVALSIDGMKKTGTRVCPVAIPAGLFEREIFVNCGRSMLRRFQRAGESLEDDVVHDRLLLTY